MTQKNCLNCNTLYGENLRNREFKTSKFCSRSCSVSYNNKIKPKRLLTRKCVICSKLIQSKYKYCGSCRLNTQHNKLEDYLNNTIMIRTCDLKKLLFKLGLKQNVCEICGIDSWNNKPICLQLHHIDGRKNNNSLDNLQILCLNCHSQTDNYGSKNKNVLKDIRQCINCNKDISKSFGESWSEYQTRKFCSRQCFSEYRLKN